MVQMTRSLVFTVKIDYNSVASGICCSARNYHSDFERHFIDSGKRSPKGKFKKFQYFCNAINGSDEKKMIFDSKFSTKIQIIDTIFESSRWKVNQCPPSKILKSSYELIYYSIMFIKQLSQYFCLQTMHHLCKCIWPTKESQ